MKIKQTLLMLLIAGYCQAQTNTKSIVESTIRWNANAFIDRTSNDRTEAPNNFLIDTDKTIEWNQATADAKQVFTIKSLDNQWPDRDKDGFVKYSFDCYDTSGTLTVQRENGKLSIVLEIPGLRMGTLSLLFEINQMTIN